MQCYDAGNQQHLEGGSSVNRFGAIVTGLITGFFSGMTGVGGGAILVSLMVTLAGMGQHKAHGTSLAVIISLAFFGAVAYAAPQFFGWGGSADYNYDWALAAYLIPSLAFPSMIGVIVGAKIMVKLPAKDLRRLFGWFLFFISFTMLTRGLDRIIPGAFTIGTPPGQLQDWPFFVWPVLGFVAGIFSGILGIGGAMVMVPVMTLGAGIPQHLTQGITLAVITLTTLTGAYTHYRLGNVDMKATLAIAPAAVVAVSISGFLATQIDAFWLTKVFGLAMAYFGYQFAFKTAKAPAAAAPPAATTPAAAR